MAAGDVVQRPLVLVNVLERHPHAEEPAAGLGVEVGVVPVHRLLGAALEEQ